MNINNDNLNASLCNIYDNKSIGIINNINVNILM